MIRERGMIILPIQTKLAQPFLMPSRQPVFNCVLKLDIVNYYSLFIQTAEKGFEK
jgi:hypothetical protein